MQTSSSSERRPRLLRITTALVSLDKLLEGQMRALREAGFEVLMCSADGARRDAVIEREGCDHRAVAIPRGIAPLRDLPALLRLRRVMRRFRPDVVFTQTPKAGLLGMLAARQLGVPVRIHCWGGLRLEGSTGARRRLLLATERLTARWATHHLANSRHLQQKLAELGVTTDALVLADGSTNGVDLERFSRRAGDEEERADRRSRLGVPADATLFLYLGRLVADKGIAELLAAFETLSQRDPRCHLLLVGDTEPRLDPLDPPTLERLETLDRLHRLPWVDDVRPCLLACDALVHPSHREGVPNVVLQAGALGRPVTCSDIAGNREALGDDRHGFVFAARDPAGLGAALEQAMSPQDRLDRGALLQSSIRQRYDRRRVQEAVARFCRDTLAGPSKAPSC
ncbi:MAG: glycosyltransferase family 1 protein [Acidobacteria bacterium]|nr:MAG: glycosyltransferase family 1 protein [Acidobacteriota bacterium]REK04385.1 MAG: glycosyltransferase family 1 protein [Acidobacteriota bacterium]